MTSPYANPGSSELSGRNYSAEILDAVKMPIFIISCETNQIRYLNSKAVKLIGRTRDNVVGQKCWDVISEDCNGICTLNEKDFPQDQREIYLKVPCGEHQGFLTFVSRIDYAGELCFLSTMMDTTDHQAFEEKLSILIDMESRLLEQISLEEKHSLVTDFLMRIQSSVYCCIWGKRFNTDPLVELDKTAEAGELPYDTSMSDFLSLEEEVLNQVVEGTYEQLSKEYQHYGRWLLDNDNRKIGFFLFITTRVLEDMDLFFLESSVSLIARVLMNDQVSRKLQDALKRAEKTVALMEGQEIRLQQVKDRADFLSKRYGLANPLEDPGGHGILFESEMARKKNLAMAEEAEIARRALLESNEQLSLIKQAVDGSSDAVAISTISGEFFYINQTFSDIFGYNIAMLAWLSLDSLMSQPEIYREALSTATRGESWQKELKMTNHDDQQIDIFLRCSSFKDEKDVVLGLIWNFTDISLAKEHERQIHEYTRKIEIDLSDKKKMLDKAALLQESLIYKTLPLTEEITVHGMFMPCETLGGDFFRIQKGIYQNRLVIILGDCTGHGVEASMDASLLTSLVDRNLSLIYNNRTDLFLEKISRSFMQISDDDQFPTMFAMVVDLDEGQAYYSNANSELPFLIRQGKIHQLERAEGMHIGYFDTPRYERKQLRLEGGDKILFFSDAVVEIEQNREHMLGYSGLFSLVEDTLCREKGEFGDLLNCIYAENGKFPLLDDMTLILLEYTGKEVFSCQFSTLEEWRSHIESLKQRLNRFRFNFQEIEEFIIALDEMSLNAINHGNKNDPARKVLIEGEINNMAVSAIVEDEGEGFDPESVPDPVATIEEIMERCIEEEYIHGRGIKLTGKLVDEISYNDKGNCVYLKKEKKPRFLLDYKKWLADI